MRVTTPVSRNNGHFPLSTQFYNNKINYLTASHFGVVIGAVAKFEQTKRWWLCCI